MCARCIEIDQRIVLYRSLLSRIFDEQTVAGLKQLIEHLSDEKLRLHPETDEKQ